jgi:hypothetical protein
MFKCNTKFNSAKIYIKLFFRAYCECIESAPNLIPFRIKYGMTSNKYHRTGIRSLLVCDPIAIGSAFDLGIYLSDMLDKFVSRYFGLLNCDPIAIG